MQRLREPLIWAFVNCSKGRTSSRRVSLWDERSISRHRSAVTILASPRSWLTGIECVLCRDMADGLCWPAGDRILLIWAAARVEVR